MNRSTGKKVAIKYVKINEFDLSSLRLLIREISILRQFSAIKENYFVTKLFGLIFAKKES
jgi:hypothetical protein